MFDGVKDERLLSRVKSDFPGFSHDSSDQVRFEEYNRRISDSIQSMQPVITVDFEDEHVSLIWSHFKSISETNKTCRTQSRLHWVM